MSRSRAALALALLTSGCYASHTRTGDIDAGTRVDAGMRLEDVLALRDTPVVLVDAPFDPSCTPRPIELACTDTGTMFVPVRQTYELPVYFGTGRECFCGEQLRCVASVRGNELSLDTVECAELLCDGCFPYVTGSCALPPMEEGRYVVRLNGVASFELEVSDATPAIGPVDVCVRPPVDTIGCGFELAPMPMPADELCHAPVALAGVPIAVDVRTFCLPCGAMWGPCQVVRTATSIRVIPQRVLTNCDVDCGMDCTDSTTVCTIPPLEPGKYELSVDGLDQVSLFSVGDELRDGRVCVSVPED